MPVKKAERLAEQVEVWRGDLFAAVATGVGAEILGDEPEDVRTFEFGISGVAREKREADEADQSFKPANQFRGTQIGKGVIPDTFSVSRAESRSRSPRSTMLMWFAPLFTGIPLRVRISHDREHSGTERAEFRFTRVETVGTNQTRRFLQFQSGAQ